VAIPPVKALICGYYGFGNAGDEAILTVLLEDLRRVHPEASVTVMAGSPEDLVAAHEVEAIHWQDVEAMIEAGRTADLMILGGGGLFQDHYGFDPDLMLTPRHGNISYYGGFALLASMTETPLAVYGIGVGPLDTEEGRRYTRLALSQADRLSIRDGASLELVAGLGIDPDRLVLGADPAFLLQGASPSMLPEVLTTQGAPNASMTIGVSVRPWRDQSWHPRLAAALDRLVTRYEARVVFVPFQMSPHRHEDDAGTSLAVLTSMKEKKRAVILQGGYTPAERQAILGGCDLVIGMRLHSVIFAANTHTPVVALSYDRKVAQVMTELGCPELVVELESLDRLPSLVEQALEQRGSIAERLRSTVPGLAERAARNREVLAGARAHPLNDPETVEVVSRLALTRSIDRAELEQTTVRAIEAELARDGLAAAQEKLTAEYAHLVGSRSMRAVNRYWKLRNDIRGVGARLTGKKPAEKLPYDPEMRRRYQRQLTEILDLHADVAGIVVFPHTIGWKVNLFQRPQQMALAFARRGYLTLYNTDWGGPDQVVGFRRAGDRFYLFAMPDEMLDMMKAVPEPLVVSYVYNFGWRRFLENPVTIFEHIDDLEVFAATHSMETLTAWYEEGISEAEVAAASALDLHAQLLLRRPDAVLCPNGVDYRHFAGYRLHEPPSDLEPALAAGNPVIGYYGALAEWIDYELALHAARALPDHSFVFIGPDYDGSMKQAEVFSLPNVWWLGVKGYGALPAYLHHFDVATIPFKVNEVTHSVSPLKLFEYMAGGRPVVTTALRECARYPAVLVAEDADDWIAKLEDAEKLGNDPEHQGLLRRTARANTWDQRVGILIEAAARAAR
jgi:polysaccharide pyruvyl transferase CsaB